MSDETDTRDRVIRMEIELEHVKKDIKNVSDSVARVDAKVDHVDAKVDEIKELLTQAKGGVNMLRFIIWLSGTGLFVGLVTYGKPILVFLAGIR